MPPTENLELWLKSDADVFSDAGVTPADNNDLVQQWNDQSGNDRHVSQSTEARKPVFKTDQLNGLPGIEFDNADDFLQFSGGAGDTFSQTAWFFFVMNPNVQSNQQTYFRDAGGDTAALFKRSDPDRYSCFFGNSFNVSDEWTDTPQIISFRAADSNSLYRKDRADIGSGTSGNNSIRLATIGGQDSANTCFDGLIMEFLFYNEALSTSKRDSIENYLFNKWFVAPDPWFSRDIANVGDVEGDPDDKYTLYAEDIEAIRTRLDNLES